MTRGTSCPHDIPDRPTVIICLHRNISINQHRRSGQTKISSFGLYSSSSNIILNSNIILINNINNNNSIRPLTMVRHVAMWVNFKNFMRCSVFYPYLKKIVQIITMIKRWYPKIIHKCLSVFDKKIFYFSYRRLSWKFVLQISTSRCCRRRGWGPNPGPSSDWPGPQPRRSSGEL